MVGAKTVLSLGEHVAPSLSNEAEMVSDSCIVILRLHTCTCVKMPHMCTLQTNQASLSPLKSFQGWATSE